MKELNNSSDEIGDMTYAQIQNSAMEDLSSMCDTASLATVVPISPLPSRHANHARRRRQQQQQQQYGHEERSTTSSSTSSSGMDAGRFVAHKVEQFRALSGLPIERELVGLDWEDIRAGELQRCVGKGAFCDVYRVELGGKIYALKRLSDEKVSAKKNGILPNSSSRAVSQVEQEDEASAATAFRSNALDLVMEARLLERLRHRNIVALYAERCGSLDTSVNDGDYFLVMDFLQETLLDRIEDWKRSCGWCVNLVRRKDYRVKNRIQNVAVGIAKAMEYIHSKNIIFRDLKPDNIGFDLKGRVKLFDFGLARDLTIVRRNGDILGFTGTPKYMANEIGEGQPYGLKVDVYSFGILLWQIVSLQEPFSDMEYLQQYLDWVVHEGRRPPIKCISQRPLQELMEECWGPFPEGRPTFRRIRRRLVAYLEKKEIEPKEIDREDSDPTVATQEYTVASEFLPRPATGTILEESGLE